MGTPLGDFIGAKRDSIQPESFGLRDGGRGGCGRPVPPNRHVRPTVLETLRLLEPAVAFVTNRLGDVLAYTSGFELLTRGIGLLETATPNLTRYVFTDPRARTHLPDWTQVADERAFDLLLGPSAEASEWFRAELAPLAAGETRAAQD